MLIQFNNLVNDYLNSANSKVNNSLDLVFIAIELGKLYFVYWLDV